MLNRLNIQNLAIVRSQSIDYGRGLTVLTGETGAGKSLLLDGLGLILGQRADSGLVNSQAKRAEVTAEFDLEQLATAHQWLCAHELDDPDDTYALCIRRSLTNDGRSKAYVNNRPVTLQDLRSLSEHLISLQGQHAAYALLQPERQRTLVDQFGHHRELKQAVRKAAQDFQQAKLALKTLAQDIADAEAQRSLLEYQVNELDELSPGANEWVQLEQSLQLLGSADTRSEAIDTASHELIEADHNAVSSLRRIAKLLEPVGQDGHHGAAALALINEAAINLDEAARELDAAKSGIDSNPEALKQTEDRIAAWVALSRKHRVDPPALSELHTRLHDQLDHMTADRTRLPQLEAALSDAESEFTRTCGLLTQARIRSADTLMAAVNDQLSELELKDAVLAYEIAPREPTAEGAEDIQFTLTANVGQKAQPLAKVASGGELSRIALAIQVCVAAELETPTLIFDEVDVGIGGRTAAKVGELLRRLSTNAQVLVVTHQPQVAAAGQTHLHVRKHNDGSGARSFVETLTPADRVDEIARMLGGLDITAATRTTAKELLVGA